MNNDNDLTKLDLFFVTCLKDASIAIVLATVAIYILLSLAAS